MTTIAPCPACWTAVDHPIPGSDGGASYVACLNERCEMIGPWSTDPAVAIAAWNRLSAAATLARHMLAWLRHLSHWTELPDDAVVLAVASPKPTELADFVDGDVTEVER